MTLTLLITSVFLLTGCPPPPDLTQWKRPDMGIDGVHAAMGKCNYPQVTGCAKTQRYPNLAVLAFRHSLLARA
ncbi:hypothetical protein E2F51_20805 [Erwinia sp. QL-Z3]|nr:hypothetical protein E2F51_20805 [Erwinia sp. QL-Z3]